MIQPEFLEPSRNGDECYLLGKDSEGCWPQDGLIARMVHDILPGAARPSGCNGRERERYAWPIARRLNADQAGAQAARGREGHCPSSTRLFSVWHVAIMRTGLPVHAGSC